MKCSASICFATNITKFLQSSVLPYNAKPVFSDLRTLEDILENNCFPRRKHSGAASEPQTLTLPVNLRSNSHLLYDHVHLILSVVPERIRL